MLEPPAPGTEGEFQMPQVSKKETEQERLLSQKAYLSNGKYGSVFELTFVNGAEHWYCNVCQCPVMGRAYHHEIGKRHTNNMSQWKNKSQPAQKPEPEPKETVQLEIAPGEPVPPGFEDEVERSAQIQERLNGYSVGPLVGLEYVIELQDSDITKEPYYLCILCDKKGDPRTVLTHLASYNHISQYLQRHFRAAYRALAPYMTKQYKRNWQTCLQKIAEAIERRFGRLRPLPVDADKFEESRMFFLTKIAEGKHFQESPNNTFEELVIKEEMMKTVEDEAATRALEMSRQEAARKEVALVEEKLPFRKNVQQQQPKRDPSPPVVQCPKKKKKAKKKQNAPNSNYVSPRRKSLSPVSSISSSDLSDHEPRSRNRLYRSRSRSPPSARLYRRSPSPRKRDYRKDSPMPWQKSSYGRQRNASVERSQPKKSDKDEKMEEYMKLAKAIENDMERVWKQHEKNPEKHPHYNEEWKKFWNKRYKEIQAEGKDASKHDFKPEWIVYWNKRMKELHDEEVKNRKEALKNRLGVTEEPTPIKFRIQTKDRPKDNPVERKPIPPSACPDSDPEVIVIDDREDTRSSRLSSRRSRSPWEKEPPSKHRKMEKASSREPSYRRSKERSVERTADRRYQKKSMERRSPQRREKSVERRSIDRRSVDRRSVDRRSVDRRSMGRKSRERSIERKPIRKSPDRRSFDRLSLDRISSSASSSDEALTRPAHDEYIDYHRRSHSRERFMSLDRPSPGVKYIRERDYHILHPYYGEIRPPKVLREATRQPVIVPPEDDDNEDINIVAVLRLLTALEEKLGSLGPKVNDLLAQALAMEKNEANSSETLLDSDINCVLFETVKEKLKGQLLAGLVDYIQEKAFKRAIKKTASLIHLAGLRKQEKASKNPVKVPGVGNVDKAAIARQIATALVLQGKTDVTQEELEQLINAVVGMAEASQKTNKPMTTAHFVEQLSGALSQKKPEAKPVEKPMEKLTAIQQRQPEAPIVEPVQANEGEKTLLQKMTDQSEKSSNMDHLSDSDLQTLLQNFKDLSTEEQHGLINYLKKLEAKEPERVEKLRKFVNLGSANSEKPLAATTTTTEGEQAKMPEKEEKPLGSPFSKRLGGTNPDAEEEEENEDENVITIEEGDEEEKKFVPKKDTKDTLDSDEEDYNFEDVVKAVSKNVEEKEQEKQRLLEEEKKKLDNEKMIDAQKLISNLISTFSKPKVEQAPVSAAEFTKTLNSLSTKTLSSLSVNMDNLANIVGNVKTLEANQRQQSQESIPKVDAESNTNSNSSAGLQVPRLNPPDIPMDVPFAGFFEHSNGSRSDFNAPNPAFERAAPRMDRAGFDGPVPGHDRPGPGFDRPGPGFDRTGQDFERPGPGFDTRGPNFERPGPGFNRPGPGFDRPRPGPGFDRPGPGFDRPGPGFDKPEYERPGFNRPPFMDRQGGSRPGFDRPDFEFDRQGPYDRQGFDRQKRPAYDRPGQLDFDRGGPGPGFDRLGPGEIERMGPEGVDRRGAGFERDGPGMNQRYDRFDVETERQAGADDFDIPGLESLERRERDRPLSDRLAPAMSRLNSARAAGGDRMNMGADRPGPGMERVGPRPGPPDRFMDRPGRDVDRMNPPHERGFRGDNEPFIPSVNDRGNAQYGGKVGAPNFRGKNPSYPPNSRPVGPSGDAGFDDRFDDGFGKKQPFNNRRGGFNRW